MDWMSFFGKRKNWKSNLERSERREGKDFNFSFGVRFETKRNETIDRWKLRSILRIDKSKRSITSVSFDSGQRIINAITQTSSDSQRYG